MSLSVAAIGEFNWVETIHVAIRDWVDELPCKLDDEYIIMDEGGTFRTALAQVF
jgi:hypothetical protein